LPGSWALPLPENCRYLWKECNISFHVKSLNGENAGRIHNVIAALVIVFKCGLCIHNFFLHQSYPFNYKTEKEACGYLPFNMYYKVTPM
jgi:hypothetical protein